MAHPHCRQLVQQYSESTPRLMLPQGSSALKLLATATMPFSRSDCIDLVQQEWEVHKRRLTFHEKRNEAAALAM